MKDFHIIYWQEGIHWVAKCLENSISSFGETMAEAEANIKEALELTLEDQEPDSLPKIKNITTATLSLAA